MIPSRMVIEVLDTFDEAVAHALRAQFMRGFGNITIDFTHASRIDPVSLARLARELARDGNGDVAVEGLSGHQERLLRYLGARLPVASRPEPAASA
jgi:hypothetical protein